MHFPNHSSLVILFGYSFLVPKISAYRPNKNYVCFHKINAGRPKHYRPSCSRQHMNKLTQSLFEIGGGSRSTVWRGPYGERGARAYNGGLGAVPPAGSRVRAPGQRVNPEAERFWVLSYV